MDSSSYNQSWQSAVGADLHRFSPSTFPEEPRAIAGNNLSDICRVAILGNTISWDSIEKQISQMETMLTGTKTADP